MRNLVVILAAFTCAATAYAGSDLTLSGHAKVVASPMSGSTSSLTPASPKTTLSASSDCPQDLIDAGGMCITEEEKNALIDALRELQNIHESKAELKLTEPITIVRDWEDRIFINGGRGKPIRVKLRIGEHVDRDLEAVLPIRVFYREKPPDPWFRLRIRAQFGVLVPETADFVSNDGDSGFFVDGGIGWDFFHIPDWSMNLAAYTGARSLGGGLGMDLTKNFGVYAGYALTYGEWNHSLLVSAYFAFN